MQRTRTVAALIFSAWVFSHNIIFAQISEGAAIKYVQRISAVKLDSALTEMPLADWLRGIIGKKATVQWELNDCGEQTGDPKIDKERDMPTCVGFYADLKDGRTLNMTILIGTYKKGVFGLPAIYDISIESKKGFQSVKRLSELEKILRGQIKK